ncbi:TPA: hypothetical protein ACKREB_000048 [Proteus mirabilis]|uniref:hypothetical protein n=1 Tax=Proteus mirabilis TaxID=584 RepID=UPI002575498B|nr:hypothetical protein [Proteus mirabilis]MDM3614881.1 hypothetical protein [Proteus mirabilis]HCZ8647071.1 hypothetical protein [Proteus mirabilis]
MPVIGHKTIAAIRRLNINGHGLKWETSVGKLAIGKGSDRYIVIIGSKKLFLSLDSTQAGYGIRYWHLCPHCSKRRAELYLGGEDLACRECWKLHYASQSESSIDRLRRKVRVGRFAIWGYSPNVSNLTKHVYSFGKPKGMRWEKFREKVAEQARLEDYYRQAFIPLVDKLTTNIKITSA